MDCPLNGIVFCLAEAGSAQAHVSDFDRISMSGHPVDPGDDPRGPAAAALVKHLDGPQACPRRYADDALFIIDCPYCAGYMCAVVVIVITASCAVRVKDRKGAVHSSGHIQIWVLEVDPGVDHRHIDIHPVIVTAINFNIVVGVREYSLDAGRNGLGVNAARQVFHHIGDSWVMLQGSQPPFRNQRRNPLDGMFVNESGLQAVSLGQPLRFSGRIDGIFEDNNVWGASRICRLD